MGLLDEITGAVNDAIDAALGVSLVDMLVQIAATLILVLVVKKFFWGKITAFIRKRRSLMEQEYQEAESANEEAEALKEKREREYEALKEKSSAMLEDAKKKAEAERRKIIEDAREKADAYMESSKQEIAAETRKAKDALKKDALQMAVLLAEKILEKELDVTEYQSLTVDRLESVESGDE